MASFVVEFDIDLIEDLIGTSSSCLHVLYARGCHLNRESSQV